MLISLWRSAKMFVRCWGLVRDGRISRSLRQVYVNPDCGAISAADTAGRASCSLCLRHRTPSLRRPGSTVMRTTWLAWSPASSIKPGPNLPKSREASQPCSAARRTLKPICSTNAPRSFGSMMQSSTRATRLDLLRPSRRLRRAQAATFAHRWHPCRSNPSDHDVLGSAWTYSPCRGRNP